MPLTGLFSLLKLKNQFVDCAAAIQRFNLSEHKWISSNQRNCFKLSIFDHPYFSFQ